MDDFVFIGNDKRHLKGLVLKVKDYLKREVKLEIHPNKIVLRDCKQGISWLGNYIKPGRIYTGRRIKTGMYEAILKWNSRLKEGDDKKPSEEFLEKMALSFNSYLGMMGCYNTYRLRRKFWQMIKELKIGGYLDISEDFRTIRVLKNKS